MIMARRHLINTRTHKMRKVEGQLAEVIRGERHDFYGNPCVRKASTGQRLTTSTSLSKPLKAGVDNLR